MSLLSKSCGGIQYLLDECFDYVIKDRHFQNILDVDNKYEQPPLFITPFFEYKGLDKSFALNTKTTHCQRIQKPNEVVFGEDQQLSMELGGALDMYDLTPSVMEEIQKQPWFGKIKLRVPEIYLYGTSNGWTDKLILFSQRDEDTIQLYVDFIKELFYEPSLMYTYVVGALQFDYLSIISKPIKEYVAVK